VIDHPHAAVIGNGSRNLMGDRAILAANVWFVRGEGCKGVVPGRRRAERSLTRDSSCHRSLLVSSPRC